MPQHFQLDAASFRFAYYLWRSQIVRIIHKLKGSLMAMALTLALPLPLP